MEARQPTARNRVTDVQVAAAYKVAQKVFEGYLKATEGVATLSSEYGLNKASAGDFINVYKYLLNGKVFQRAMSAPAMRYFMEHIFAEQDGQKKTNAVAALKAHIAYYEDHYKTTLHTMGVVADDFATRLHEPPTAATVEAAFSLAVKNSLHGSRQGRLQRIAVASRKPTSMVVMSTVFVRNPDVVAEALVRAGGKCEACNEDAPFLRARDGTPYLEVHHKVPLAAGGDDTLENAEALCPNCHRRAHYGTADF